jgi:hypothetical protein
MTTTRRLQDVIKSLHKNKVLPPKRTIACMLPKNKVILHFISGGQNGGTGDK